jgi:hypothetical protein
MTMATSFAWESSESFVPGTTALTLAGFPGRIQCTLFTEISARRGRRFSVVMQMGKKIRRRIELRLSDRSPSTPRVSLELGVSRV